MKTGKMTHFEGLSNRFQTYLRSLESFAYEVENEIEVLADKDDEETRKVYEKLHKLIDRLVSASEIK